MKKLIVLGMAAVLTGIAMMSTGCDNDPMENVPTTVIIPNVVECVGHTPRDTETGYARMLVCDDGRVFHNITNYRIVKQLNPLYQGGK